jgi:hypothetical protein
MRPQHRFVPAQVGAERPIQAQECTGGEPAAPEVLAVFQTREIERFAAVIFAKPVQRPPIKPRAIGGQVRTRRKRAGHRRSVATRTGGVNAPRAPAVVSLGADGRIADEAAA